MTGRTRPNHSRSPPVERQLSSVSNTTTDEYDLLVEEEVSLLPYNAIQHPVAHDSDDDTSSSDPSDSGTTPDQSLELSSSADVDPDALLQLMSDQGTPTLHAIGRHSPLSDDDDVYDDDSVQDTSDSSSLLLPDSATTVSKPASSLSRAAPTIIRVLYLGCATEADKASILKKLSEGLAEIFLERPPDTPYDLKTEIADALSHQQVFSGSALHTSPNVFKERKYNVLPLSTTSRLFGQHDDEPVETYEDNGLAIIEADFTRSSDRSMEAASTDTVYDYVIQHMDIDHLGSQTQSTSEVNAPRFEGYVYPDATPDGVDLVVYFYSGLENDEERQSETEDDMILLWKLRQLGIPVLPILSSLITSRKKKTSDISVHRDEQSHDTPISVSSGSTGSGSRRRTSPIRTNGRYRPHDQFKSNADYNQTMMENRTYLSNTLAEYRIQCLDVMNLEIGRPSFHRRSRHRAKEPSKLPNEACDQSRPVHREDWETSSLMPAPWQIMTVEQFTGLDKRAVYEALKKSREMAVKRETVREVIRTRRRNPVSNAIPADKPTASSGAKASIKRAHVKEAIIRSIIGVIIPFVILFVLLQGSTTSTLHLSNSTTTVGPPAMAKLHPMWSTVEPDSKTHLFVVEVFDKQGRPSSLGPEGVKLKTFPLRKDGGEITLDMAELGHGQYMLEVLSPCYQDDHIVGMQVEFETIGGIPVQNSPVTLTAQACPAFDTRTNRSPSAFKNGKSLTPPPPPTLRTFKHSWNYAARVLRKVEAQAKGFAAFRLMKQAHDWVQHLIGTLWDEIGTRLIVQWLPATRSAAPDF
ncbi:hypothetical protein Unana1_01939 [Umbelopsis nana]